MLSLLQHWENALTLARLGRYHKLISLTNVEAMHSRDSISHTITSLTPILPCVYMPPIRAGALAFTPGCTTATAAGGTVLASGGE